LFFNQNSSDVAFTAVAGSIRAATFYDRDNTDYYVDPAGTSNISKTIINSSGTGNSPSLRLNISTSTTFIHAQENFANGMTAGQHTIVVAGKSGDTKNSGYFGYCWNGDASDSNFVTLGHWGADDIFRVYGAGYSESLGSLRAPLFIDSDNTAYYVDPAGTSRLSVTSFGAGQTVNGQSHFQFEGATYRNPADHTPPVLIRLDNSSTGIVGSRPALSLYNNDGGDQTTIALAFVSRESTAGGNAVNLAGIVAKKEIAGNIGSWTDGSLTLYTRTGGTRYDGLSIGKTGIITTPYQPSFSAYLSGAYQHPSGVVAAVGGTWSTHHNIGSHYSTATRRFTAPVSGSYHFNCSIATEGGIGTFGYLSAELYINGGRVRIGGWGGGGDSYGQTSGSYVVYMNAGDYAELGCEADKTFPMQIGNHTMLSGYLIG
jgi:hypothetical protein